MRKSSVKIGSYRAGTLDKGLTVLETVEKSPRPLTIQEVAAASRIQRLAVFRLLTTLEARGYVLRGEDKRYRSTARRRRIQLGYAGPMTGNWFRQDMAASIERAAAEAGMELVAADNREDDAEGALANARMLVERRVDVAMFFEPVESLGHMMADRFFSAGIPFITIERPIQGGVYFGANNYQAGKLAGVALGRFAKEQWRGRFDHIVLVEAGRTSTNVQARVAGVLVGLREVLGGIDESRILHVDGKAHLEASRDAMAALLPSIPSGAHLLISGFNDMSAVGALLAVRAAGREREVAVVGQNASREGRAELRRRGSRLIASVAYFPERYGDKLVRVAGTLAQGGQAPPAVYTEHLLLDRGNVDRVYPER